MNRRLLTVPVLAGAALALAACTGPTPGTPTAATPTSASAPSTTPAGAGGGSSPTSGASDTPLASVDPCSLITQDQVTKNGFTALGPKTEDGARSCSWQQKAGMTGMSGNGYVIDIRIYDHLGLDGINATGDQVSSQQVGSHQAREIKFMSGPAAGGCAVVMGVTAGSSVYVSGQDGAGNQTAACTDASAVAAAVEPKIPEATG